MRYLRELSCEIKWVMKNYGSAVKFPPEIAMQIKTDRIVEFVSQHGEATRLLNNNNYYLVCAVSREYLEMLEREFEKTHKQEDKAGQGQINNK
jgi:hypothetical protein